MFSLISKCKSIEELSHEFIPKNLFWNLSVIVNPSLELCIFAIDNVDEWNRLQLLKNIHHEHRKYCAIYGYYGGVNLFPAHPIECNTKQIDELLFNYGNEKGSDTITYDELISILNHTGSHNIDDWNNDKIINRVRSLSQKRPKTLCKLIVRRERDITKGTETLLSPMVENPVQIDPVNQTNLTPCSKIRLTLLTKIKMTPSKCMST